MKERIYCSDLARTADAPLAGSAVPVDLWLLLEYPRPWKPKALQDNELGDAVCAHLEHLPQQVHEISGLRLRVQFIKQGSSDDQVKPRVMVAHVAEGNCTIHAGAFDSYADMAKLSASEIVAGQLPNPTDTPDDVLLVCTNGQRDLCCARFGLPLFESLRVEFSGRVWQTTHIGGHRYAPNLVCLPSGFVYGFVDSDAGVDLVSRHDQGEIDIARLRGRTCYSEVVQAAEVYARSALNEHAQVSLQWQASRPLNQSLTEVTFEIGGEGTVVVEVDEVANETEIVASCGADPKRATHYRQVGVRILNA